MRYTIPSFAAARKANRNLFCDAKKIDNCHHTLTAWEEVIRKWKENFKKI